jgi:hypothetical protein
MDELIKVPERIYINNIECINKDTLIKKIEEYMYEQLNEGHIQCSNIKIFLENFKKYIEE